MPLDYLLSFPAPCTVNCHNMGLLSPQDLSRLTLMRIASPGVASLTLPPPQHSPQLHPLRLLQIVTTRCRVLCLQPLKSELKFLFTLGCSATSSLSFPSAMLHTTHNTWCSTNPAPSNSPLKMICGTRKHHGSEVKAAATKCPKGKKGNENGREGQDQQDNNEKKEEDEWCLEVQSSPVF